MVATCGTQTQDQNKAQSQNKVEPFFQAERDALKKAEEVEKMVMDAAAEQRKRIDAQEQ